MNARLSLRIQNLRHAVEKYHLLLEENKPQRILEKGYSVLEGEQGVITSIEQVRQGNWYKLTLADGSVTFQISDLKESR